MQRSHSASIFLGNTEGEAIVASADLEVLAENCDYFRALLDFAGKRSEALDVSRDGISPGALKWVVSSVLSGFREDAPPPLRARPNGCTS